MSVPTAGIVRIGFETVANAEVRIVTVASSGKPVFAKPHEVAPAPRSSGYEPAMPPSNATEGDPFVSPSAMGVLVGVGVSSGQRRRRV